MAAKRFLCLWLPAWPIQRFVVERPEFKGRAIVLHARHARRGRCVVACSQAAYRAGVRPGMPIAEATALLPVMANGSGTSQPSAGEEKPAIPNSYLARHQSMLDREVLRGLASDCEQFSPHVGFEPSEWREALSTHGSPASIYLDITNLGEHFGGDIELARCVARFLEHRGYRVRIGVADTLGAAWAAAHFGSTWATPLGPCHAPDAEPNRWSRSSYWVIESSMLAAALRPLPIEALRLDAAMVSSLHKLGVFQIHQLTALPRAGLAARYGRPLLDRWDQAFGKCPELLELHRPAPVFQTRHDLEHPTRRMATIRVILERLVHELCTALTRAGQGVLELECCFACERPSAYAARRSVTTENAMRRFRVTLVRPTASVDHLAELLWMQVERLALPGAVESMALRAAVTRRLDTHQQPLAFEGNRPSTQKLARLVDRIGSRLGKDGIVRPCLRADRQPERAYEYVPAVARQAGCRRGRTRKNSRDHFVVPAPRPLFLRSPPALVSVEAVPADGPPGQFHFAGACYHVVRHWGPERIETGWWRGGSIRRDYFRVETDAGDHFWLFRQLGNGQWFLHGTFE